MKELYKANITHWDTTQQVKIFKEYAEKIKAIISIILFVLILID